VLLCMCKVNFTGNNRNMYRLANSVIHHSSHDLVAATFATTSVQTKSYLRLQSHAVKYTVIALTAH